MKHLTLFRYKKSLALATALFIPLYKQFYFALFKNTSSIFCNVYTRNIDRPKTDTVIKAIKPSTIGVATRSKPPRAKPPPSMSIAPEIKATEKIKSPPIIISNPPGSVYRNAFNILFGSGKV